MLWSFAVCAPAHAADESAAAVIPIEHFTRPADIVDMTISPTGKRLAMLSIGPDGYRRLAVMDVEPRSGLRTVASYGNGDVTHAVWVNDDRIVYEAFERGPEIEAGGAGTFAVDHDGQNRRQLIAWQRSAAGTRLPPRFLPYGWSLRSSIGDGSDEVYVTHAESAPGGDVRREWARLDTRTGATRHIGFDLPDGAVQWWGNADREPRLVVTQQAGRVGMYWRALHSPTWEQLSNVDASADDGAVPFTFDGETVLVSSRAGGDKRALYHFDPVTKRIDGEPVLAAADFDIQPHGEMDGQTRRMVGVHYVTDHESSHWFEPGLAKIQLAIDAALPKGRFNRLTCGRCESTRFLVVFSYSDREPGEYYLFDREKRSLAFIAASRPWIAEDTQAPRTFHRITARDGLTIPVYVTHPVRSGDATRLPAVVLAHDDQFGHGTDLGWSTRAQFLASRGYVVIEPAFRGSTGYGLALHRAGRKQWGRKVQDDLVDAVRWASDHDLIDPSRVCVAGDGFGGYTALMATIADPGIYRCAASYAGYTDIGRLIGDLREDDARSGALSPLKRAGDIKVPVLVAYGAIDRVAAADNEAFVTAARRAGVPLESVEYPKEGHGFYFAEDEADFDGRLERLLAAALSGPASK